MSFMTTPGSRAVFIVVSALAAHAVVAASPLDIDWSENTYGPDGPWNAVTVLCGGRGLSDDDETSYVHAVDMFPGSVWETWTPSNAMCVNPQNPPDIHHDGCASGGTWEPETAGTLGRVPITTPIAFQPTLDEYGIRQNGTIYLQPMTMTFGGMNTPIAYNTTLASVSSSSITYPNKVKAFPPVGFLALDTGYRSDPTQNFGDGYEYEAWLFSSYLYNQSILPSYSFGLTYGSARFGQSGSLTFGGYNTGRIIGPYTTWTTRNPKLLDVTIGVETGASPFTFSGASGFLRVDDKPPDLVEVTIDPVAAYMYLPGSTCEALADVLPIYFDQASQYYLWDTQNPLYERITTSAAYLGFEFPSGPSSSDNENVLIKIPFALLDLVLTSPIVSEDTHYFPCVPYVNWKGAFVLGRAFLQGAYLGRNSNSGFSYLAQAAGPNAEAADLYSSIEPMYASDMSLYDLQTDPSYFANSWSGYWSPLPNDYAPSPPSSSATPFPTFIFTSYVTVPAPETPSATPSVTDTSPTTPAPPPPSSPVSSPPDSSIPSQPPTPTPNPTSTPESASPPAAPPSNTASSSSSEAPSSDAPSSTATSSSTSSTTGANLLPIPTGAAEHIRVYSITNAAFAVLCVGFMTTVFG